VDSAKDYEAAIPICCRFSGQLERVPDEIAQLNDFFPLVMVGQNNQLFAEFPLQGPNSLDYLRVV